MFPVKVVAIDNDQAELDIAIKGLVRANIPLLPIKYDDLEGIGETVSSPLKGVRLVFCDINLNELNGTLNASQVTGIIAQLLKDLISSDNGPYVLVFWSKHPTLVDDIKQQIHERYIDVPSPAIIGMLDKNALPVDFLDTENQRRNVEFFLQELNKIVSQSPVMELLLRWESICTSAASQTTNNLYQLALPEPSWASIGSDVEPVGYVVKRIAEETVGSKNLAGKSSVALKEGLIPILHDNLSKIEDEQFDRSTERIIESENSIGTGGVIDNVSLNSFYHIDFNHLSSTERGSFIKINIEDNAIFESLFKHNWSSIFSEFYDQSFYREYVQRCRFGQEPPIKTKLIRNASVVGLIEISPSCDHAQNKQRNHRYLLTVLIPYEHECVTSKKGDHQGVHVLPPVNIRGASYSPRVNFRYVVGLNSDHQILQAPLFRLREQILNEVTFKYAQHASRPGIISFF